MDDELLFQDLPKLKIFSIAKPYLKPYISLLWKNYDMKWLLCCHGQRFVTVLGTTSFSGLLQMQVLEWRLRVSFFIENPV